MKKLTTEQMELIELLKLEWKDPKMVDHCFKTSEYLKFNGKFIDIADSKPSITKTLWFDDEYTIPGKDEQMFIDANMRLNAPKPMELESYHGDKLLIIAQYCNDKTDNRLCGLTYDSQDRYPDSIEVTQELLNQINSIKAKLAVNYEKRLRSYWKRYNKNIRFSGYWVNR